MASEDTATLLQGIGTDLLRSFVSVVVETWVVAIYTVLMIKASFILLNKARRRSKVALGMWVVVLALYMMDLVLWIIDVRNVITEITYTLTSSSTDSLGDRLAAAGQKQLRLALVEDVLYAYMVLLGDAIMFWRVYAFWHDGKERIVLILPFLVYLTTFTLSCLVSFCAGHSGANLEFGAFTHPPFCRNIQLTSYWVQFCTALVATSMIGFKTWTYRRMVKPLSATHLSNSSVHRIMTILIDSGLAYMLFFAAEAILSLGSLNRAVEQHAGLSFAIEIYQYLTSSIVGIYPTIVVILVHSDMVLVDSHGNTTEPTTLSVSSSGRQRNGVTISTVAWSDALDTESAKQMRLGKSVADSEVHEMHLITSTTIDPK